MSDSENDREQAAEESGAADPRSDIEPGPNPDRSPEDDKDVDPELTRDDE